MAQFRKKPVVIDAYKFENKAGVDTRPDWIKEAVQNGKIYFQGGQDPYLTIETLEGKMKATLGDWIIKGVHGELYPCKNEIFEKTYEPI